MIQTMGNRELQLRDEIEQLTRRLVQCSRSQRASAKSAVSYLRQVLRDRRDTLARVIHSRTR